jgi:hypothetical protein
MAVRLRLGLALLLLLSACTTHVKETTSFDYTRPPEHLPVARVHSRVYFQTSFLAGSEIGHDEGAFQDSPSFHLAFGPGIGGGFDFVYSVTPMLAFQYNLSFQQYSGREVDSGIDPQSGGTSVDFGDMWALKTSVGPRLSFPIELPPEYWDDPEAIPYVHGLVPYVRTGIGYALSGEVDATIGNNRTKYYNMTGSLHLTLGIGMEVHGKRWGCFVETFAVERWGPLEAAREPEAKEVTVIAFPFSFGVLYRY